MSEPHPAPLSVVIADPNSLTREGLNAILGRDPRFHVAGTTAGDPAPLLIRHRPDLLMLDPGEDADGWGRQIAAVTDLSPGSRVCIYTERAEIRPFLGAIHAGADGYLIKGRSEPTALADLLVLVGRGLVVGVEPWIAGRLRAWRRDRAAAPAERFGLPERERAVLIALAAGTPDKLIAARLGMTCSTVRTYVWRLRRRFRADSRAHLVANAIRVRAVAA